MEGHLDIVDVNPGAGSRGWGNPGDWMLELRYRVPVVGSPWGLWTCDPKMQCLGKSLTLENVDM